MSSDLNDVDKDKLIEILQAENTNLQLELLRRDIASHSVKLSDHEKRLRMLGENVTKFNTLLSLSLGGGLLSAIGFVKVIFF